jgi:hypothetical protein
LTDVVAIHRATFGTNFWENYEYLYHQAKRWAAAERSAQPEFLKV